MFVVTLRGCLRNLVHILFFFYRILNFVPFELLMKQLRNDENYKKIWESWKDWSPLHGLPYGLVHGLPYGLPLRTTLKNKPNSFYRVQRYKKLTCSSYTIITARKTAAIFFSYISRSSVFCPIFHRPATCQNAKSWA